MDDGPGWYEHPRYGRVLERHIGEWVWWPPTVAQDGTQGPFPSPEAAMTHAEREVGS